MNKFYLYPNNNKKNLKLLIEIIPILKITKFDFEKGKMENLMKSGVNYSTKGGGGRYIAASPTAK